MTSPHADPEANGTVFGAASVTVDVEAGDCVVRVTCPGPVMEITRTMRLHSLDELQQAFHVQHGLSATDPIAADIASALIFASRRLCAARGRQSDG